MSDNTEASDFLEKPLTKDLKLTSNLWHIEIDPIKDYFGEKVAIYFTFLSYYSKMKGWMAIIGLVTFILQEEFLLRSSVYAYDIATLVYVALLVIWLVVISELWKRKQSLFAMKYGMTTIEEEDDKTTLSGFEG